MQTANVAIVTTDSLLSAGLKHLIRNLFDIETAQHATVTTDNTAELANADLIITDAMEYVANPEFFIPRRNRLLIIGDSEGNDSNNKLLNRHAEEADIIKRLTEAINGVERTMDSGEELSQREIEVLREVANGYTNKEIADNLNISVNTVLSHRKNITSKLGIKSVSGLSVYAIMNGYISSDIHR